MIYRQSIQLQIAGIVGQTNYWNFADVMKYVNPNVFGMPAMAWEVLIVVWAILVSVFYAAHYQCVELDYFDAARQVSGAETDSEIPRDYAGPGDGE